LKWGTYYIGDIGNTILLNQIFKKYKIDLVMHFAAFAYVGESNNKPSLYYKNNIVESVSLLDAMVENNCLNLIFSSSCATYGNVSMNQVPIKEDTIQNPINPYGNSKLFLEKIIRDYESAYNLKSIVFRYFNAAGSDPDLEIGEVHEPETHLIPLVIRAALSGNGEIGIYGNDYETPDGTAIRDYVHVNDIVSAHELGISYLLQNQISTSFNIGLGKGYSVKEVIEKIEEIHGKKVNKNILPRRQGDPPVLVANSDKICSKLNWSPYYKNLEDVILTAYRWEKKRIESNTI
jgi:UDP-glucose 4-epimerase